MINWGLEIHTIGNAGGEAGLAGVVADLVEEGAAVPVEGKAEGAAERDEEEVAELGGEHEAQADEAVLATGPGEVGVGRHGEARDVNDRAEEGDVSQREGDGVIGRQSGARAVILGHQRAGGGGEAAGLEGDAAFGEAGFVTFKQMLDRCAQAEALLRADAR